MPQLYPRGIGASEGAVPDGYVEVHRWTEPEGGPSLDEEQAATHIPGGLGAGGRVYVTTPGRAPTAGRGASARIEFFFPQAGLQIAGHPLWYQIIQPAQNTPVYNVKIFVP